LNFLIPAGTGVEFHNFFSHHVAFEIDAAGRIFLDCEDAILAIFKARFYRMGIGRIAGVLSVQR